MLLYLLFTQQGEVLMKTLKTIVILVVFLILTGFTTPKIDPGGFLHYYMSTAEKLAETKETVIIDYVCISSCTMLLSSGEGLRVSKYASFGVHEVRYVYPGKSYFDKTS